MISLKYFPEHFWNQSRRISLSPSTRASAPMIMVITPTAISRMTTTSRTRGKHRRKRTLRGDTSSTLFASSLMRKSLHTPMASIKNGLRPERSLKSGMLPSSRTPSTYQKRTRHTSDDSAGSKPSYSFYTPVQSSSHHTDRRKTASRGAPKSFRYWRTRSLDRLPNRSIDSQIRSMILLPRRQNAHRTCLVRCSCFERTCLGEHQGRSL